MKDRGVTDIVQNFTGDESMNQRSCSVQNGLNTCKDRSSNKCDLNTIHEKVKHTARTRREWNKVNNVNAP